MRSHKGRDDKTSEFHYAWINYRGGRQLCATPFVHKDENRLGGFWKHVFFTANFIKNEEKRGRVRAVQSDRSTLGASVLS